MMHHTDIIDFHFASGCTYRAPRSYVEASASHRDLVANGLGPGSWPKWYKRALARICFPGLNVAEVWRIHDWQYAIGGVMWLKILADHTLRANLGSAISAARSPWPLRLWQQGWAAIYCFAVLRYGNEYFVKRKSY